MIKGSDKKFTSEKTTTNKSGENCDIDVLKKGVTTMNEDMVSIMDVKNGNMQKGPTVKETKVIEKVCQSDQNDILKVLTNGIYFLLLAILTQNQKSILQKEEWNDDSM